MTARDRLLLEEIAILEELQRREKQRLFYKMFPDEDTTHLGQVIHARDKYPKHIEFFEAGKTYRERCVMAANRCITPWTFLETEAGSRLSAEIWTSGDAQVLSWDGESQCAAQASDGILKCIEPTFRIVLGNGQFFDCTRKHRVLTSEGWTEFDQLVSRASGLRLWYRREDYQANCDAGGYLGDRPLHFLGGIDLASLRPQGDVQKRAPFLFEQTDEVARTLRYSRAYQLPARLSSPCDLRQFAALFALFSGPSTQQPVLRLNENIRNVLRFVSESAVRLQSGVSVLQGRSSEPLTLECDRTQSFSDPCSRTEIHTIRQAGALYHDVQHFGGSVEQLFCGDERIAIFYPMDFPSLVGGQKVAAIVPLGLQPIIDATVEKYSNYKAGGVFHHNTGKSFAMGGYETSAHLTGKYPDWWPGRRFDRPVRAWAAGKTNETTRDIVQTILLGEITHADGRKGFTGTGVIPGDLHGKVAWKQGVQDLADTVKVKHVSGGWSTLGFKSYQQGRGSFEGTAQDLIWLDEEPPLDVYGECLIRTATTDGLVYLTFTPLEGMSETVMQFMPKNAD